MSTILFLPLYTPYEGVRLAGSWGHLAGSGGGGTHSSFYCYFDEYYRKENETIMFKIGADPVGGGGGTSKLRKEGKNVARVCAAVHFSSKQ